MCCELTRRLGEPEFQGSVLARKPGKAAGEKGPTRGQKTGISELYFGGEMLFSNLKCSKEAVMVGGSAGEIQELCNSPRSCREPKLPIIVFFPPPNVFVHIN